MKIVYGLFAGLAVMSFNLLSAQGFTVQKKDNITAYTNNADVVSYASKKTPEYIEGLKQKYKGLTDVKKVDELVSQQNYIEVLNYVWTEPDSEKKLSWLKSKASEGHPILMFELGEEYYRLSPSMETYVMQTMPWLLAGTRMTYLDAICSSDKSVLAAPDMLLSIYQTRILEDVLKKDGQASLEKYIVSNAQEFQKNNLGILKQVLQQLLENPAVPSPAWVFPHGMASFTGEKNTITSEECMKLRKQEAQALLDQVNEIEAGQKLGK